MQRNEVPRHNRIGLQFLPKFYDVDVYRPCVRERLVPPHKAQDHVARQRPIRIFQKVDEQLVFRRSELQFLASTGNDAAFQIDLIVPKSQHRTGGGAAAAQDGSDAGHQLTSSERLDQIVVRSDLEQQHLVDLVTDGAEYDDW